MASSQASTRPVKQAADTPESEQRATLVWFRRDLRLDDNPAWQAALARGGQPIPVFIWAPEEEAPWAPGAASRWWLHHSLSALQERLAAAGCPLIIRRGPTQHAMQDLLRQTGATAVFWNRLYEPAVLERDKAVKTALRAAGVDARSFNSSLLHEPWTVQTQQGKPYQVFTPFYRTCQQVGDPSRPVPSPAPAARRRTTLTSLELDSLKLRPDRPWDAGLRDSWQPGEAGALALLENFAAGPVARYQQARDLPAESSTSRLSPHLHFGEVGPRQIWWAIRQARHGAAAEPYLRQLVWREFAHHLLYHFPHTPTQPLRPEFSAFPWHADAKGLKRWQRGLTGYPIVDAGMRELWHTGWMHNRVRMIVASFLVKDLLIPWQEGAAWFWDTLVDASLANNTLGWQWTAGCGADAAPFFRVFNPALQGEKFDPQGIYVRRWVPELASVPDRWIHRPEEATTPAGKSPSGRHATPYPPPVVDHAKARDRALQAYSHLRAGGASSEKD